MLGRLESCTGASRFDVGGEGGDVSSGGSARASLCREVGEVGDDCVPHMCGRGGKARGRRRLVASDMRGSGGHGGCRSGEEEGLDRWAPPVSSRRERMEAKWRKKR